MNKDLIILSVRDESKHPAVCCIVEMEDALSDRFEAERVVLPAIPNGSLRNKVILFTALNFGQAWKYQSVLSELRQRDATIVIYVFDTWNVEHFFYNPKRRLMSLVRKHQDAFYDFLCVPFMPSLESFASRERKKIRHVPLGVDSQLVNGFTPHRPISVLGYGRQPPPLLGALSEHFNDPKRDTIFHFTDHLAIKHVKNREQHRRHFWKLAQSSAIALAFDPHVTHPERFPVSIVGQRWYESLAAGCVIVGVRPRTWEVDELLNWEDSTLELPRDEQDAIGMIEELLGDPQRLRTIRERNTTMIRKHHDWRYRFDAVLAECGVLTG